MPDLANVDYVTRVNRVIDHVQRNLDRSLRLEDVAAVAHFSPFHFHRIFKSLMGETLAAFVKRLRLEKALHLMSHANPPSLTRVALECGFASSSDFSRSFRGHFGVPPSKYDLMEHRRRRRCELQENMPPDHKHKLDRLPPGMNPDGLGVRILQVPARRVVYSRVFDPFRPQVVVAAAASMVEWAREQGVHEGQWLGYMWEDPDIVELASCRYDVGLEVPFGFEPGRAFGVIDFPPMTLAHVACAGPIEVEQRAIDWTYGTWLPSSGWVPDDQPAFEAWNGLPFADGVEHFDLAFQLPIRRVGARHGRN